MSRNARTYELMREMLNLRKLQANERKYLDEQILKVFLHLQNKVERGSVRKLEVELLKIKKDVKKLSREIRLVNMANALALMEINDTLRQWVTNVEREIQEIRQRIEESS